MISNFILQIITIKNKRNQPQKVLATSLLFKNQYSAMANARQRNFSQLTYEIRCKLGFLTFLMVDSISQLSNYFHFSLTKAINLSEVTCFKTEYNLKFMFNF